MSAACWGTAVESGGGVTGEAPFFGFAVVDKPAGMSSHGAVAAARRIFGMKKIGHAGTLDPMATGLLVLGLGRATRLLRFVTGLPKEYIAAARFGVATDTLDADGEVTARAPMDVSAADVERVLPGLTGDILQTPPMVSALKVGGKRLYDLARSGVEVEREARPVTVYRLSLEGFAQQPGAPPGFPEVRLRTVCGAGCYVRSLADDAARALGGRAHLTSLRRTRVGMLDESDALSLEELSRLGEEGRLPEAVIPPGRALSFLPAVEADGKTAAAVANGRPIPDRGPSLPPAPWDWEGVPPPDPGPLARVTSNGRMLAVYRRRGENLVPEVVLA